ncbi:hypothetical protein [Mesorhizobium sp.]|uniref:hypothetical protein n=1 Tax=Mesorhizobium sp. TaxID=1871066 RepID=UPI000FE7D7CC|nr:hypothetical protein [Mesorhizobium sp.]RWK60435.1 MAG: hypothetical protein EOR49_21355 [Mesorhizobium sp.]RWM43978.1 MAG: hypothetical protein EOR76_27050 [Mesorhizobium sp.]RWM51838.1 MAG: hypothetical protein EOR78_22630 [Mesorhizobium sp.]RWM61463.1 MAG: hypothetical protein EOR79_03640 [Mesorhizobium sp.]RWM97326.1 MAG: hypothetical protein EOR85_21390 [Mesorhizobium sp.]
MSGLHFVPFIVLALGAILCLYKPLGRDLAVPVFFLPWGALTPDVGVNLPISKVLFLFLALKYSLHGRFGLNQIPHTKIIALFTFIGIVSGFFTLAIADLGIEFAGGDLRNGGLRVAISTITFLLSLLPFALLFARGVQHDITALLRTYVISVAILCVIGIVQYAVFRVLGTDILPIGLLSVGDEAQRSGMLSFRGELDLRPSSLAGEPKVLALFAASAGIILVAFGQKIFATQRVRLCVFALALCIVYLTQSTSALIALPIGLGVYLVLKTLGRPLSSGAVLAVYLGAFSCMLVIYLSNVTSSPANSPFMVTDMPSISVEETNSVRDLFYQRTLGRIEVEDMDWVIIKSFLADPSSMILGRGFGLGHLTVDRYIPDALRHYMEGRVIAPKSGVTYFLVNGGIVMMVLMAIYLAKLTPVPLRIAPGLDSRRDIFVRAAQLAMVPLILMMILRVYLFDVTMFVCAACLAGARIVGMARGIGPRLPDRNAMFRPAGQAHPIPKSDW